MSAAYHPIESYGLVGNQETAALVGSDGSVDWFPVAHVESPSVFSAVLDDDAGGRFRVGPDGGETGEQVYIPRTNVLRTRFETADGALEVTDFLPPVEASVEAPHRALFRQVSATAGSPTVAVEFSPRLDFARADTRVRERDGAVVATGSDEELVLDAGFEFRVGPEKLDAKAVETLDDGDTRWLALRFGEESLPPTRSYEGTLDATVEYWQNWSHGHPPGAADDCIFGGVGHDEVVRSELVLKLLSHAEEGSVLAAPTTSLPEEIGGVRNWDYRYSWPRDAAFTVQALAHLGHVEEAGAYFDWFKEICHQPPEEIRPLYGLHGEVDLDERVLDHLEGYRGSSPVRIGNAAVDQRQIDVYGELVLALSVAVHHGWELDDEHWPDYRHLVDHVVDVWDRPDSGFWEVRSEPRHFVHSKLMCWTALDRGIAIAENGDWNAPLDRWREVHGRIREEILEEGFDEDRNTFTRAYDGDALDATALLIPVVGFLPFDDERVEGTVAAVREDLETEAGFVRRYDGADGLPGDEGTFTLCSFWLVDVLALSGRLEEAQERFDTLLEYASPLGLFAEEIDPAGDPGVHRGNYPQAFSHVGLVNSALYLGRLRDPEMEGPDPVGIWLGEGPAIPD